MYCEPTGGWIMAILAIVLMIKQCNTLKSYCIRIQKQSFRKSPITTEYIFLFVSFLQLKTVF